MLPIRDKNPSPLTPWVMYALLGLNVVVFLFEVSLPGDVLQELVNRCGFVPARATAALQGKANIITAIILPALASMFLHGGWMHLIGNMWYLYIFGDNVEGRLGHVPFVAFYFLCGLGASAMQYLLGPTVNMPTIGASGAIAGVLGAYLVTWPRARVVTLVPLFYLITFVELPAAIVLWLWFIIQLFSGAASLGARYAGGGVAYWAHIGGFLAGIALMKLLGPVSMRGARRARYRRDNDYWQR